MKRDFDLKRISLIFITVLIGGIMFYTFVSMIRFSENSQNLQTQNLAEVIQKAAIQCYALEGQYPTDINYLADNYGIVLDKDKYIFFYSNPFGINNVPDITVIQK